MRTRKIIYADEGKVLTNGTVYGRQIILAHGDNGDAYYEITETEYEEILQAQYGEANQSAEK